MQYEDPVVKIAEGWHLRNARRRRCLELRHEMFYEPTAQPSINMHPHVSACLGVQITL